MNTQEHPFETQRKSQAREVAHGQEEAANAVFFNFLTITRATLEQYIPNYEIMIKEKFHVIWLIAYMQMIDPKTVPSKEERANIAMLKVICSFLNPEVAKQIEIILQAVLRLGQVAIDWGTQTTEITKYLKDYPTPSEFQFYETPLGPPQDRVNNFMRSTKRT